MKRFGLFLLALFWSGHVLAGQAVETPEQLQLKDQMRGLMQAFQGLESSLDKKPPDYDTVLKLLDEMDARAKMAQSLKPSGHPRNKDFKKLFRDIDGFKKSTQAKSSSGMEDSMNRLAENCFRCHLSHR